MFPLGLAWPFQSHTYTHRWGLPWVTQRGQTLPRVPQPSGGARAGPASWLGLFPHTQESHHYTQGHAPRQGLSRLLPKAQPAPLPTRDVLDVFWDPWPPSALLQRHPPPVAGDTLGLGRGLGLEASSAPLCWPLIHAELLPCSARVQIQGVTTQPFPALGTACAKKWLGWSPRILGVKRDIAVLGPGRRCPEKGPTGSLPTPAPRTSNGTPSVEPGTGPGCQLLWLCPCQALGLRGLGDEEETLRGVLRPSVLL